MNKPSFLSVKNLFNKLPRLQEIINESEDNLFEICPFTIILGSINTTNAGYKNVYSIPNDYTAFSQVFTGEEALVAVWDNSYTAKQTNNPSTITYNADDYYGTKTFKVGTHFYGLLLRDEIGLEFTSSAQNSGFIQEQVNKSVSLIIQNNEINKELFNNLPAYFFKLWMIPRLNIEILNTDEFNNVNLKPTLNPYLDADKQWYTIISVSKVWNKNKREIAYIVVNFQSLNDKLARTGLAINQYVQIGGPGEKASIPTIDAVTSKISLDKAFLEYHPITHIQVTFFGSVALNSIAFYGRTIKTDELQNPTDMEKVTAPHLIFPYAFQAPLYDNLSLKGLPQNSFYLVKGACVLDSYYQTFQAKINAQQLYDEQSKKQYEGHFRSEKDVTRLTNPLTKGSVVIDPDDKTNYNAQGLHTPFFQDWLKVAVLIPYDTKYNVIPNHYFFYLKDKQDNEVIPAITDTTRIFKYSDIPLIYFNNPAILNMFNHFISNNTHQIPLSIRETTTLTLSNLPFVGSFFNRFLSGFNIGWKKTNIEFGQTIDFLFFFNCDIYNAITDTLYAQEQPKLIPWKVPGSNDSIIPLNVFASNQNEIASLAGAYTNTTAFCFDLTDEFYTSHYSYPAGVKRNYADGLKLGEIVYLGQIKPTPDGTGQDVAVVDKDTRLAEPSVNIKGYVIDGFVIKSLGQVSYKIDFFSVQGAHTITDYEDCVYSATYQSLASISENTRLWTESKTLSNPLFKFKDFFHYPHSWKLPPPADYTHQDIVIPLNVNWEIVDTPMDMIFEPDDWNLTIDNIVPSTPDWVSVDKVEPLTIGFASTILTIPLTSTIPTGWSITTIDLKMDVNSGSMMPTTWTETGYEYIVNQADNNTQQLERENVTNSVNFPSHLFSANIKAQPGSTILSSLNEIPYIITSYAHYQREDLLPRQLSAGPYAYKWEQIIKWDDGHYDNYKQWVISTCRIYNTGGNTLLNIYDGRGPNPNPHYGFIAFGELTPLVGNTGGIWVPHHNSGVEFKLFELTYTLNSLRNSLDVTLKITPSLNKFFAYSNAFNNRGTDNQHLQEWMYSIILLTLNKLIVTIRSLTLHIDKD